MNEQEDLLEGLEVVRACGCANMFDRQSVARLLEDFGYLEEYEVVKNMSPSQYVSDPALKWLGFQPKTLVVVDQTQ